MDKVTMTSESKPAKYPRTPCWVRSPSFPRGDKVTLYLWRFINVPIVVTEKLDGSNTALRDGKAFTRAGERAAPWLRMARKHHAWKTHGLDGTLYGEDIYGVHSIEYGPVREQDTFRAFALLQYGYFQSWERVEQTCAWLDIPIAPVLFRGEFSSVTELDDFIQAAHHEPSCLGGEREGVVLRIEQAFPECEFASNVCKSVRLGHVQTGEHWTRNWRPCLIAKEA